MCGTCGCGGESPVPTAGGVDVALHARVMAHNDHAAEHNRAHFREAGLTVINLMGSPGAGKTALLEATIAALGDSRHVAVIEGDLDTENDADRIRRCGVPAVQIQTGSACHLDAHMVHAALHEMDLDAIDLLFIENVGNLVCPASFDLGQHANVALLSTPEGHDKPAKYPVMFRAADLVLLSKSDLLEVLGDFDVATATDHVRGLANAAPVIPVSSRSGAGMDAWLAWLGDAS